jgi:hypothetical protein
MKIDHQAGRAELVNSAESPAYEKRFKLGDDGLQQKVVHFPLILDKQVNFLPPIPAFFFVLLMSFACFAVNLPGYSSIGEVREIRSGRLRRRPFKRITSRLRGGQRNAMVAASARINFCAREIG